MPSSQINGALIFFSFIRNHNKLAFLEKNPLKHALFTLQHYPAFRRKQKTGLKFFSKTAQLKYFGLG